MLRLTVLLLLLANAAYFAWSQGLLAPWGIAPAQQSEPQRLEQQIKPQAVRILRDERTKPARPAGVSAGGRSAGGCCSRTAELGLQAGLDLCMGKYARWSRPEAGAGVGALRPEPGCRG